MTSKTLLSTVGVVAAVITAVTVAFSGKDTVGFVKAANGNKIFAFDSTVASQVQYGGNETTVVSNVVTGISTPISTKLYRESGPNKEYAGNDGCFFSANYSNERTFAFEAGLNNLVEFEIQFKYSYDSSWDSGLKTYFAYNVIMTFYHGNTVVDTANYSCNQTTRETTYTHTWTKGIEVSEKIDRVKCSLDNCGGSSTDDWRVLKIIHYKVTWNC